MTYELKDIHGNIIQEGDIVMTVQPPGGFLPPGPPVTGVAEKITDSFGRPGMQIRYRSGNRDFDQFILLDGKINEIIKP